MRVCTCECVRVCTCESVMVREYMYVSKFAICMFTCIEYVNYNPPPFPPSS